MTQMHIEDWRIKAVEEKLREHPVYQSRRFKYDKEMINVVIDGFLNEGYVTIHKDELAEMIRREIDRSR